MDDLDVTTNTSLSLNNVQTGLLNKNLGFDQKDFVQTGLIFIPSGWSWIGQTRYTVSNNAPNFSLNIASSVYIYNIIGNTSGSGAAGVSVPI